MTQAAGEEKKQMKISDLEERTGIPRETIHYYIREGLLPPPFKKGLRLAYYDESYVSLIDLIKKLQEERYLPLSVIRNLFREQKYDIEELEKAFLSDLFGHGPAGRKTGLEKIFEDLKEKPVQRDYLLRLSRAGILAPGAGAEGREPTEIEIKLAQLCQKGESLGFSIEQLHKITGLLGQLVELEGSSLIEMLRHKETPKEFVAALKNRQGFMEEFILYQRGRLFQEAVQAFMRQAESTRLRETGEYLSVPSEAFRKRYRIDEQVAQLKDKAAKSHDEKDYDRLGWCLLLTGKYADLFALDDRRRSDRFKLAVAYANAMKGEAEAAVKWAERAVKRNATDAFFLSLSGGLYMIYVTKLEGFIEPTIWISKALDLLDESARLKASTEFDAFCAEFVRLRIYLTLPEPLGRPEESRKALEKMLDTLRSKGRAKLECSFEGELEIFEVSINYFLAEQARTSGQKSRAVGHYKRVLEVDPASEFGQKAFVRLGEFE